MTSTARGFEPLRAEPNGFLVHHLSHSVRLSLVVLNESRLSKQPLAFSGGMRRGQGKNHRQCGGLEALLGHVVGRTPLPWPSPNRAPIARCPS